MFSVGKTAQIVAEAKKYRVKVLGISECRWSGFGRLRTATGETILYSGRDDNVHQSGVALLLNKETAESLLDWNPVSDRTITARFNSKCIKTTCVQAYAPTNDAEPEVKDEFYEQLQAVTERAPSHDMLVMMGGWNAKVGRPNQGEEGIVGKHALEGNRTVVIVPTLALLVASDWLIFVLMTSSKLMTSQVSTAYRKSCGLMIGC